MYGRKRRFGALLRREFPEYDRRFLKYIRTGAGRHGMRRSAVPRRFFKRNVAGLRPRALLRTGGLLPYPSNIERKFVDTALAADATTTASINIVNAMAPGTSASTRIGRRILMKSLQIRAQIEREDPATTTSQHVRMMIVYDRQSNATAPAITDIIDASNVQSLRNMANVGRFFMIADEFIEITAAQGGNQYFIYNKFVKFNLPVYYNAGTAGTVADIATGGLFVCYLGSQAAGVDDINVTGNCRLRFTDM